MTLRRTALIVCLALGGMFEGAPLARASDLVVTGFVTDAINGGRISGVCLARDPAGPCLATTDTMGFFTVDAGNSGVVAGQAYDLYFVRSGYQTAYSGQFTLSGQLRFNQVLMPDGQGALCPAARTDAPTRTVYLANITKTLGGIDGWQTPFIVQNTGTQATTLEVTFYRFLNGACARRRVVTSLAPATSFADIPNKDNDLPGDTQFAVVVRSFGAPVVAVANGHQGAGVITEIFSYDGVAAGATTVYLPNIVRRFFSWDSPFIIQNLGATEATAVATFTRFDGVAGPTVTRQIPAGGSKFVDPSSEPGLADGTQYSVTVTSAQPLSVVVDTHDDGHISGDVIAYSTNGIATGASRAYGPYAVKPAWWGDTASSIVVQNISAKTLRPRLDFVPLGASGPTQSFTSPSAIGPGAAWAFDPRFGLGTTTPCTTASVTCLGEGEYSFVADSGDATANIGVAVNVIGQGTASGYTAIAAPSMRLYAPNVTRVLGGPPGGWTGKLYIQSVGANGAVLEWRRFSDGALVLTQTIPIPAGGAVLIDPRDVAGLTNDTQYSVVMTGTGGSIAAVIRVSQISGDAAFYEAFSEP